MLFSMLVVETDLYWLHQETLHLYEQKVVKRPAGASGPGSNASPRLMAALLNRMHFQVISFMLFFFNIFKIDCFMVYFIKNKLRQQFEVTLCK